MKHVAIIGATGSLGRTVAPYLQEKGNYKLTLFSRHACRVQMHELLMAMYMTLKSLMKH